MPSARGPASRPASAIAPAQVNRVRVATLLRGVSAPGFLEPRPIQTRRPKGVVMQRSRLCRIVGDCHGVSMPDAVRFRGGALGHDPDPGDQPEDRYLGFR